MFDLPAAPPRVDYLHHRVTTDDGVPLSVQSTGEGPPVLIANGIGVTRPGLDHLIGHLAPRHRVITWDYRGCGESWVADGKINIRMERQAADALQVMDALDVESAAVLGWSMGVPVGLEMIRQAPERVTGLGALFGAPGKPFKAAFRRPVSDAVHLVVRASALSPVPAQAAVRIGAAIPPLAWAICSTIGFVGKQAHRESFHADVDVVSRANPAVYFRTLWSLVQHDASDLLPSIECPVLVVAGEADWVTPPHAAETMARAIPGAELVVFPDTSHFGVIEHGPSLWTPIDRLMQRAFDGAAN